MSIKITISQVPFKGIVMYKERKFRYDGQEKIKVGGGHVTKYIFTDYISGKKEFFGVQHQFDLTKNGDLITLNK